MNRAGEHRTDVVVVGAGPAGATAARTLAAAGVSTVLLDRAAFPRHKPCGGALSVRALGRFPYLASALRRIPTHWISRLQLESPAGHAVQLQSETPAALMIRRVEFDALLVELAREAGAMVFENAEVVAARQTANEVSVTSRDGRRFSGRCLIACDGVHSVTARRLGIADAWPRETLAVDMMEETPNSGLRASDPGSLWVRYGYPAPGHNGSAPLWEGYAYVFPKREHVNVGIGYLLSAYRAAAPGPAYDAQRTFVESLTRRGILEGESRRDCFTPFLIPVRGPRRVLSAGRVLLAGDAGGFVHGLTAEGIFYAMISGDSAGATIVRALRSTRAAALPDLSSYSKACRNELGAELRDAVMLQRYLFSDPARIDMLVEGAQRHRTLTRAVIGYLMGQGSYGPLRARAAASNPRLAVSLALSSIPGAFRFVPRCS